MDIGLMCGAGAWPVLLGGAGAAPAVFDMAFLMAAADASLSQTIGSYSWMILSVAAGLTFVIFVHELGHFLVAKACGVKCEKFYVGFDFFELPIPFTGWKIPSSLVKFRWGETEYGIGILPLGGYVKMLGQDDDPRNAEAEAARIKSEAPAVKGHGSDAVAATTTEGKTIFLDPRSYPAKPVPARMAIISAGVIMNLIFAVLMAAAAFRLGVEETPAIVGAVTPGGPAWEKNIEPGSRILQIGRRGQPREQLRFSDLLPAAMLSGTGRELPLLVRKPDGEEAWYHLRPTDRLTRGLPERRAMLGIAPGRGLEIGLAPETLAFRRPRATPALREGDRVVRVAGQTVASGEEVFAIFAQHPLGSIDITIERGRKQERAASPPAQTPAPERIEVRLAEKPLRELGMTMKLGPVVAVREDSPAAEAGFHAGDTILQINGQPAGDPLSLSTRLLPNLDGAEPLSFLVARKVQNKTVERTLTVLPELPKQSALDVATGDTVSIESIGLAVAVSNEVAEVAGGGPAALAGLAPGDIVTVFEFPRSGARSLFRRLTSAVRRAIAGGSGAEYEAINLEEGSGWAAVHRTLQWLPAEKKVRLTWRRGEKTTTAELATRESATLVDPARGLDLITASEIHRATGLGDSLRRGAREAYEQAAQVVTIIHRLVTGGVSATSISGPAGIIYVAGRFASEGTAKLLIFLTMLSANLAVLNFLPIPALDGGHMLFLTAEWIRGRPVDERLQIRLTIVGVICLLSLMVFATAMDIQRWFS